MKTWAKVLLGLAAGIGMLLVLAVTLLVRSGRWEQVRSMAGGISQLKRSAADLERMQREHPFIPPADGLIPESRLMAYLEICEALQPFVKPYEAWMESHLGKQGDFKDAVEAIGFMGKVTAQAAQVCRSKGMSPQELAWMHRSVRKAVEEAQQKGAAPEWMDLMAVLRKAASDPGLSLPLRKELQEKLERYGKKTEAGEGMLSVNARLCALHGERIRRADLGDFSTIILEGSGKRRGRG